ncbi:MAG: hypothetical protein ACRCZB_03615 [Bacteroidales bacterium]
MRILFIILLFITVSVMAQPKKFDTKKYTKQNIQRKENKKMDEVVGDEITKDDPNYKDLDKIRHRCMHFDSKSKTRCGRKAGGKLKKYCLIHRVGKGK